MLPPDEWSFDFTAHARELLLYISSLSGATAYATIVGTLVICGLGIPIPEDITLLAAGLLASDHRISLSGALAASFFGVIAGDAVLFFLGRKLGRRVFLLPGFRRYFTPERILRAEAKIQEHGPFICFVARFLPGLRSPTFAAAGAMGVRPATFLALDGFAALISVPVWVGLGFWFGNNWQEAVTRAREAQGLIIFAIVVLIGVYLLYRKFKARTP